MNRKELSQRDKGKKVSATEFRKREKECRKLQQELTQVGTTAHSPHLYSANMGSR